MASTIASARRGLSLLARVPGSCQKDVAALLPVCESAYFHVPSAGLCGPDPGHPAATPDLGRFTRPVRGLPTGLPWPG